MSAESGLALIAEEVRACEKCPLHLSRTNAVPGEGASSAEVMVVGEGPGRNEDLQGRPFVGAAGRNLEAFLGEAGLRREEVFITNVVKCRPPENRRPSKGEADACYPYLRRQVELLSPRVVVLLGDTALKEFFPDASLSASHGRVMRRGELAFFPTYHPASVIYNRTLEEAIRSDFRKLGERLRSPQADSFGAERTA